MRPARLQIPASSHECPSCSRPIRASHLDARNRARCPSCLQIVSFEAHVNPALVAPRAPTSSVPHVQVLPLPSIAPEERATPAAKAPRTRRTITLEQRVAALEQALAELSANPPAKASQFQWLAAEGSDDYSAERAGALQNNLRAVAARTIGIHFSDRHEGAFDRADWLKKAFEGAGWFVDGPREVSPEFDRGISLATALPVLPETAALFIAMRAVRLPVAIIFSPELPPGVERLIVT